MRSRLTAVLSALLLLAGCQPQQPPNTAVPTTNAPSGIGLPAPDGARRYDTAIRPVDEARTVRSVQPPRAAPSPQPSERERLAIAAWEKEEAAAGRSPLTVALPPPPTRSRLSLPSDDGALPPPPGERSTVERRPRSELAIPPSTGGRAELPKAAEARAPSPPPAAPPPAPPAARAPAPPPVPPPAAQAAAPAPAPPPAPRPPARPAAEPVPVPVPPPAPRSPAAAPPPPVQTATAAPAERAIQPPPGPPLTTVIFSPRSANLSDGARIALGFFAQDPKTQRLRRIELWACASADDPADAGKIAFARALAVHAFLIDQGVKASIEIAGYSEALGVGSPDRVDVMTR